jgi:hypothetical protein
MSNRQRFRSRFLAWLGAAVLATSAVLLLAHLGTPTADGQGTDKDSVTVPPDLAWVPPDAALFATVRPAGLWNSPEGKILREQFPDLIEEIESHLEREIGLKLAEMESLTWVMPEWWFRGGRSASGSGGVEVPTPPAKEEAPAKVKEAKNPAAPAGAGAASQPPPDYEPDHLLIATATEAAALKRIFNDVKGAGTAYKHNGKLYYTVKEEKSLEMVSYHFVDERTLVRGGARLIRKGLERTGNETRGPLAPALRLAKEKHHVAVGLQLTEKEARELLQDIAREHRGVERTLKPLFRARAAAGFADIGKETRAEVEVFFRDGTQAKTGLPSAEDALSLLRVHVVEEILAQMEEMLDSNDDPQRQHRDMFGMQIIEQLEKGLRATKLEVKGGLLRAQAKATTDLATMLTQTKGLLKAREADEAAIAMRNIRKNQHNLRQIGLALHNFHDSYKNLPPAAICDKQGKPLLSWRVAILPFIEQAPLYQQFKLDEPWDSPHNSKLVAQMPPVFAPVGIKTKEAGLTYYRGFVADPNLGPAHATAWETTPAPNSPYGAWGPRLIAFTDGTSNTLLLVEAGEPVPWTKPAELPYDPKKPLPKLGGVSKDGFNILMADGSTRFAPANFDEQTLRLMITRADGQPLGPAFNKLR